MMDNLQAHPLSALSQEQYRRPFLLLLFLTFVIMFVLNWVGIPLTTSEAPYGIVSFELAGTTERVTRILASWDDEARMRAAFSLGFDYVFMLAYSTAIGLACIWVGKRFQANLPYLSKFAVPLAWGLWMAAGLDAVENLALSAMLFGSILNPWSQLAFWCAILKFALVFIGLVFVFLGAIIRMVQH